MKITISQEGISPISITVPERSNEGACCISVESSNSNQITMESIVQAISSVAKNVKFQSQYLKFKDFKLIDNKSITNGLLGYVEYTALKTDLKCGEKYYHLIAKDVVKNVNSLIDQLEKNPVLKKLGFKKYNSDDEFSIYDNSFEHEFGPGDSDFAEIRFANFKSIDNSVNDKLEKDMLTNVYNVLSKNKNTVNEMFDNQIFGIFAKLGLKKTKPIQTVITKSNTKTSKYVKVASTIDCTGFKTLKPNLEDEWGNKYFYIRGYDVFNRQSGRIIESISKLFNTFLTSNGIKIDPKLIYGGFGVEKVYYVIGGIKTLRQIEKETASKSWGGFRFGSDETIQNRFTFDIDKNTLRLEVIVYPNS